MNHDTKNLSLTDLIQLLKRSFFVGRRSEIFDALKRLVITDDEIAKHALFSEYRYSRNLVFRNKESEILLICWKSGQRSQIHDHGGSFGVVKVVRGILTESVFMPALNGMIKPLRSVDYRSGDVQIENPSTIHQVSNLQPEQRNAVSCHVYLPPLTGMNTYRLYDCHRDPAELYNYGSGI